MPVETFQPAASAAPGALHTQTPVSPRATADTPNARIRSRQDPLRETSLLLGSFPLWTGCAEAATAPGKHLLSPQACKGRLYGLPSWLA